MTNYPENTQSLTSGTHFSIIFLLLTTRLPGAQRCVLEKLSNTNPSLPAILYARKPNAMKPPSLRKRTDTLF